MDFVANLVPPLYFEHGFAQSEFSAFRLITTCFVASHFGQCVRSGPLFFLPLASRSFPGLRSSKKGTT